MITLAEKYQDIPDCGAGSRFASFSWPVASYNDQHATVTTTTFTTKARRHEDFSTNERGNYSDNLFVERRADADWSTPPAGTAPLVNNLYQDMALDAVTGLYYERFRNYSPSLGTWISQDPLSYINGANTYQFVKSGPTDQVDATGLAAGQWAWKALPGGKWEGSRGVTHFLGTVVTYRTHPSKYGLLTDIIEIMKFSPVGASILESVNHILDTQDFSDVRWRFGIFAAWEEHEIVCKKGAKWIVSKKWVTGQHSFSVGYYGKNGGAVVKGSHETSQDVFKSAFDVAKEITKFEHGGE